MKFIILLLSVFIIAFNLLDAQSYKIIHQFGSDSTDGLYPWGSLIESGSKLYGTTRMGGKNHGGTIFSINPDGSGYKTIYSFLTQKPFTWAPNGTLLAFGSCLYGMTLGGGANDSGAIFKINQDGSGFTILYNCKGGPNDGFYSESLLIHYGSVLYGSTFYGGLTDSGTIFKINIDGSGFEIVHSFDNNNDGGIHPSNFSLINDSVIYGESIYKIDSTDQYVTKIFRINTNGSGFRILHNFDSNQTYYRGLFQNGTEIFGISQGSKNSGQIFKMNLDGSGYTTIHTYSMNDDGDFWPESMISSGNMIYGITKGGGTNNNGTIFRLNYKDTSYTVLYNIGDVPDDIKQTTANRLLIYNGSIYGLAEISENSNGGAIFSLSCDIYSDTCSNESFIKYDFKNSTDIIINSSAKLKGTTIRLVPSSPNLAGSIFNKQPITISNGFDSEFSFRFTNGYNDVADGSPAGADGIAFVIQATNPGYYGKTGGGIGYSGIANSIAVEFDDYKDDNDLGDPDGRHVAVFSNGKEANSSDHRSSALLACTSKIPLLKADSTLYYGKIEYLSKEKKLNIYLDTTANYKIPVLVVDSLSLTKLLNLIGGDRAFVGFTSATGASYQNTDLISWSFCSKKGTGIKSDVEQTSSSVPDDLNIFPNPVSDFLSISMDSKTGRIEIYSIFGECVLVEQTRSSVPGSIQKIDVSKISSGFYFVKNANKIYKFVKL